MNNYRMRESLNELKWGLAALVVIGVAVGVWMVARLFTPETDSSELSARQIAQGTTPASTPTRQLDQQNRAEQAVMAYLTWDDDESAQERQSRLDQWFRPDIAAKLPPPLPLDASGKLWAKTTVDSAQAKDTSCPPAANECVIPVDAHYRMVFPDGPDLGADGTWLVTLDADRAVAIKDLTDVGAKTKGE